MILAGSSPHRMRIAPFAPLPDGELCAGAGGRLWLEALAPRAKNSGKGPFARARTYARSAAVAHLVIEPGAVRCLIDETPDSAPSSRAYATQPHPTVQIPVLDQGQWRDLTVITRHLAGRLARLPAEEVLQEITSAGARNGIRLLPSLDQCRTSCSCSSRSSLCKHLVTALVQAARCLDTMPLALLLLRGRSPVDFFSGLHNPDHPSLSLHHGPRRLPDPPVTSAQTVYDRWQTAPRPLPPVPSVPGQPATPVFPTGVFDAQVLSGLAAGTARRAHSLLRDLTGAGPAATAPPEGRPGAEAGLGEGAPVSPDRPGIPLQQRLAELQRATGMTRAELARAVRDWGLSD